MECFGKCFCKKRARLVRPRHGYDSTFKINKATKELSECAEEQQNLAASHEEQAKISSSKGLETTANLHEEKCAEARERANYYELKAAQVANANSARKYAERNEQLAKQLNETTKVLKKSLDIKRMEKVAKRLEKCEATLEKCHLNVLVLDDAMGISESRRPRRESVGNTVEMQQTHSSAPTYEDQALDQRLRKLRD